MADMEKTQNEPASIDDPLTDDVNAVEPNDIVTDGEKRKSLEKKENPEENPSEEATESVEKPEEAAQPRLSLPKDENVSQPEKDKRKSSAGKSTLTEPLPQPVVELQQKKEVNVCNNDDEIQGQLVALFGDGADQRRAEWKGKLLRPKLIFHNTYQLGPTTPFVSSDVEKCINITLTEVLTGQKYYSPKTAALTATLAEIIRDRVLTFNYDRHKIIVFVTIGPMARQGVEIGFRCLWDTNRDSYAKATFKSYNLFASACVYGIYYE